METSPRQAVSPLMVALVIVGILAASAFIYFQLIHGSSDSALPPLPTATTGPQPVKEPPPAALDLPHLAHSDRFVRPLIEQLSEHPALARWLTPDRLVERFVTTVVNVADGESPRSHLLFLEPGEGFTAAERGGDLYVAGETYDRFDTFVEVFTSLDTAAGVRLYRELEPLFDEAYAELGYPTADFDAELARAVDHILATPIPSGDVEIERWDKSYRYADPALERLSPAQKHFLRMGAGNMRQVHAKLRLMRTALGLD